MAYHYQKNDAPGFNDESYDMVRMTDAVMAERKGSKDYVVRGSAV